jgi:hypothetical protein
MNAIQSQKTGFGGHSGGNILEFYAVEFRPEPSHTEFFRQQVVQWFKVL